MDDITSKQTADEIAHNLAGLLSVDELQLGQALRRLMEAPRALDEKEEFAQQTGIRITNNGKSAIAIADTVGGQANLTSGESKYFVPKQFGLEGSVPNAPYHALGVLPSAYIYLSVKPADQKAAEVEIDWEKMFENSGIWGNLRLVSRIHTAKEIAVEPVRELKWKLKLGGTDPSSVEIMGQGLGMDIMSRIFPESIQLAEGLHGEKGEAE